MNNLKLILKKTKQLDKDHALTKTNKLPEYKNNNNDTNNNLTMDEIAVEQKVRASTLPENYFQDSSSDCDEYTSKLYYDKRQRSITNYELQKRSPTNSPKSNLLSMFLHRPLERVPSYKTFRIMVLGDSGVGKTSFIRRFVVGDFNDDHIPTISDTYETGLFVDIDDKLKQFDLEIYDYNGDIKEYYTELYEQEILKADGFIVMYSKENPGSLASVVEKVADINIAKKNAAVLVLENKTDLKKDTDSFVPKFQLINCRHMEISAKSNKGITDAITSLILDIEEMSR